jgi:heme-degrading monooxygenase HmoA
MFVVVQKLTVEKENVDALVDSLSSRDVLTEQDGFVDLSVMKHQGEDNVVGVIGRWESKDAWRAWEDTDTREEVKSVDIVDAKTDFYELEDTVK